MDQNKNKDRITEGISTLVIIYSVVAFFCVLINARVFYIVGINSKRKSRPANILVAHLSIVVIGFTCVLFAFFLDKSNVISLSSPVLCNLPSQLGYFSHNLFSLNLATIIWVRTRKDPTYQKKRLAFWVIGIMWTIISLGHLPYLFLVEFKKYPGRKCEKINLLGSVPATVVFEVFRLLFFYVVLCIFIIRVTIKLQTSMKFLKIQRNQSRKTKKAIQQVRVFQLHTILLMFTWFPHGISGLLFKLLSRLSWMSFNESSSISIALLTHIELIICPLSFVYLLEEIPLVNFFLPCWRTNGTQNLPMHVDNHQQSSPLAFGFRVNPPLKPSRAQFVTWSNKTGVTIYDNNKPISLTEPSLVTTVGITRTLSLPIIVPTKCPAQFTTVSELEMPSTSQNLQSVKVKVHLEPKFDESETDFFTCISKTWT